MFNESNPLSSTHLARAPNKSLLRLGDQWYLVCNVVVGLDRLPMISLGEPPGAELSRHAPNYRYAFIP